MASCECVSKVVSGIVLLLLAAGLVIALIVTWPLKSINPCVSGQHLRPHEQMWCSPKEFVNINGTSNSKYVDFYRVPKKELPPVSYRGILVEKEHYVSSIGYYAYEFEAMSGTIINGKIQSSNYLNDCYLMNYDDFENFKREKERYHSEEDEISIVYYRKWNKGTLSFNDYHIEDSGVHYFVIDDNQFFSATATVSVTIKYAVYNMSSFTPEKCKNFVCVFELVGPNETIIADNKNTSQVNAMILLPDILNWGAIGTMIGLAIAFTVIGIILLVFVCIDGCE